MSWTPYRRGRPTASNETVMAIMVTNRDPDDQPTEFVATIATAKGDWAPIYAWRKDGDPSFLLYNVSCGQIERIGRVKLGDVDYSSI